MANPNVPRNSFGLPSFSSIRDGVVATVSAVVRPDTPPLSPSFPPLVSSTTVTTQGRTSTTDSSLTTSTTTKGPSQSQGNKLNRKSNDKRSTNSTRNDDDIPFIQSDGTPASPLTTIADSLSSSLTPPAPSLSSVSASSTVAATLSREELSELAIRMNKRATTFERKVKAYRIGLVSALAILEDLSTVIEVITNYPLGYFLQTDPGSTVTTTTNNINNNNVTKAGLVRNTTYLNDSALLLKDGPHTTSTNNSIDSMDTIRHELRLLLQNHHHHTNSTLSSTKTSNTRNPNVNSSPSGNGLTAAAVRAVVTVANDILPMGLRSTTYPDPPYVGYHVNMDNLHALLCETILNNNHTTNSPPVDNPSSSKYRDSRTNSLSESGSHSRRSSHTGTGTVPPTPVPDTSLLPPPALGDLSLSPSSSSSSQQQHIASLSALVASQNAQIRRLTNELVQAHKEAAQAVTEAQKQATTAIQDADTAQKYSEDAKFVIDDLRSQLQTYERRYTDLQSRYDELNNSRQVNAYELQQVQEKYERTYKQLQTTEEHNAGLRAESDLRIKHLDEEIERLKAINETTIAKLHALESHHQTVHRTGTTGKVDNDNIQLKHQLNELKIQKLQLEEQLKEAKVEIQTLMKSFRTLSPNHEKSSPATATSSSSSSSLPSTVLSVTSSELQFVPATEVRALQERLTDLTHRLSIANHELDDTTTALVLARQQESLLKNEIKVLQKQLESAMILHNSVPLTYLKNIIIQFIGFAGDPFAGSQRKALIGVLATLLNFDDKERKKTGAPADTLHNNHQHSSPVALHREKLLMHQRNSSSNNNNGAKSPGNGVTAPTGNNGNSLSSSSPPSVTMTVPSTVSSLSPVTKNTAVAVTPRDDPHINELTEITNILTSPLSNTAIMTNVNPPPVPSMTAKVPTSLSSTTTITDTTTGNGNPRTGYRPTPTTPGTVQRTSHTHLTNNTVNRYGYGTTIPATRTDSELPRGNGTSENKWSGII